MNHHWLNCLPAPIRSGPDEWPGRWPRMAQSCLTLHTPGRTGPRCKDFPRPGPPGPEEMPANCPRSVMNRRRPKIGVRRDAPLRRFPALPCGLRLIIAADFLRIYLLYIETWDLPIRKRICEKKDAPPPGHREKPDKPVRGTALWKSTNQWKIILVVKYSRDGQMMHPRPVIKVAVRAP